MTDMTDVCSPMLEHEVHSSGNFPAVCVTKSGECIDLFARMHAFKEQSEIMQTLVASATNELVILVTILTNGLQN